MFDIYTYMDAIMTSFLQRLIVVLDRNVILSPCVK